MTVVSADDESPCNGRHLEVTGNRWVVAGGVLFFAGQGRGGPESAAARAAF